MIDPQHPDYSNTPVSAKRPCFGYAPIDSSQEPYVTIVTPFYNTGSVFHETARSVLGQSFQQWQWLIVNDGSTTAESLAVLDAYRMRDERIRIIDLPLNSGPAAARNVGFREARTAYVAQVDSDDLLEPTAIEKWLWLLESYPEYSFVKGYSVGFGAQEYLWPKGFPADRIMLQENQVELNCMLRRSVHHAVGGYDESIRSGLEDWDFWLRCADAGYWGATIPEYLGWYRRSSDQTRRWAVWDNGQREWQFRDELRRKYPRLWREGLPHIQPRPHLAYDVVSDRLPFHNRLVCERPRLLMAIPRLEMGGADKFNLDLLRLLVKRHGYEVTIVATVPAYQTWLPEMARLTSDIFVLDRFLRPVDYPRFLHYLLISRQIDTLFVSGSELAYLLLPYLRATCPGITIVDYLHMEAEGWKNGGYPRMSLNQAAQIDLTITSSEYLKHWLVERGGDPGRIQVCTTNIDPDDWNAAHYNRQALRDELGVDADLPVILYAARICAQKQPLVFAEVLRQLKQRGHSFSALVAGDGEDRATLEAYVKRHALNEVRLLGSVSLERMRSLMALSDIFFLPSQHEGISLAIYEAMAMGVVPVGADVGGQRELVTPDCGILVQPGSAEVQAYVIALEQLLQDRKRRMAMGQAARQRVQDHYQLEQMGQRMVDLVAWARKISANSSWPTAPYRVGVMIASQVIEQLRLENLADQLWVERETALGRAPLTHEPGPSLAWRGVNALKQTLRPIYHWAIRHRMGWLVPLRRRLSIALLRWVR